MAYRANAEDPERTAALDAALVDLARRQLDGRDTMAVGVPAAHGGAHLSTDLPSRAPARNLVPATRGGAAR